MALSKNHRHTLINIFDETINYPVVIKSKKKNLAIEKAEKKYSDYLLSFVNLFTGAVINNLELKGTFEEKTFIKQIKSRYFNCEIKRIVKITAKEKITVYEI